MIVYLQKRADSAHVGEKIYFEDGWYKVLNISHYVQDNIPLTAFKLEHDVFLTTCSSDLVDIKKFSLKRTLLSL